MSLGYLGLWKSLSKLETTYIHKQYCKEKHPAKKKKKPFQEQFKTYSNKMVVLTRICREDYYSKYFKENKKDTIRIWSAIRKWMNMNVKPINKYQPWSLVMENKTLLNLNIISNHFIKFFLQIARKIEKLTKKTTWLHISGNQMNIIFFLSATCQNDVEDIIQNMQTDHWTWI